jgi:pilus assembly protein CpaB
MTRAQSVTLVTIAALFFAGLASFGLYRFMTKRSGTLKSTGSQPTVVVAATGLPVGAALDNSQQSGTMSGSLSKGHRAITVAVNEVTGVAGFIMPTNHVDLVLTTSSPDSSGGTRTRIILQNVSVLATGQITAHTEGKPILVPTVTLDLSPADAEILVHASHNGNLQLLLRNGADATLFATRGTTTNKVMGVVETPPVRSAVAPITPQQRPVHTVTIIDGGVRTTKEFVLNQAFQDKVFK